MGMVPIVKTQFLYHTQTQARKPIVQPWRAHPLLPSTTRACPMVAIHKWSMSMPPLPASNSNMSTRSLWAAWCSSLYPVSVFSTVACRDGSLLIPMGILGLQSRFLPNRRSLHWRSFKLWHEERHGCTILGIRRPSRYRLQLLRIDVLCLRDYDRSWRLL